MPQRCSWRLNDHVDDLVESASHAPLCCHGGIFALAVAGLSLNADDVEAAAYTARVSKVKGKAFYRVSARPVAEAKEERQTG